MKMRMPSSPHSLSVRVAPQAQVVANEEPYRGMNQNTNFVEYDGQLASTRTRLARLSLRTAGADLP